MAVRIVRGSVLLSTLDRVLENKGADLLEVTGDLKG